MCWTQTETVHVNASAKTVSSRRSDRKDVSVPTTRVRSVSRESLHAGWIVSALVMRRSVVSHRLALKEGKDRTAINRTAPHVSRAPEMVLVPKVPEVVLRLANAHRDGQVR